MAMYLFDLDNLKKVNDQYGHEKGDEMIRSFGNLLRHHTRDGDILCRYGGDEFVVILRRISSENAILRKGAEICEGANRFFQAEGIRAGASRPGSVSGMRYPKEKPRQTTQKFAAVFEFTR